MLKITLPDYAQETIIAFIRDFVGDRKVVVGLSGGLDSSTVAKLCTMALGKDRVLGVHMPDEVTPEEDKEDARDIAKLLGIEYREIPIGDLVSEILRKGNIMVPNAIGNVKARLRMLLLYAIANENGYLVAGTSNKTELLVGYFTKYGDGASDFAPIGDLYKKVPRAGLLPGQTDEGEMGVKYEDLDRILLGMELGYPPLKVAKVLDVDLDLVQRVYGMHEASRHKRVMLYIPKIGLRTVNTDWRE